MEELIKKIVESVSENQDQSLESILRESFSGYEIKKRKNEIEVLDNSWKKELQLYLSRKKIEGKSQKTIEFYRFHLEHSLSWLNKPIADINEDDLLGYMMLYKEKRNISDSYLDTIRRIFTSFFGWCRRKGYLVKDPAEALEKIKVEKLIKEPFSDVELEKIRQSCKTSRDRAIVEMFYATGMRVSEMEQLNRTEVDFLTNTIIITGKGKKQRRVYFTPVAGLHLQEYLNTRTDNDIALFVNERAPYGRTRKESYERMMRKIGKQTGIDKCHPHRFRRTMATNCIKKGMPVEEVKEILGHDSITTTMIYAEIDSENVKHDHRKFMGA